MPGRRSITGATNIGLAPQALEDRPAKPGRIWNRIPDDIRDQVIELALQETEQSPRESAVRVTDPQRSNFTNSISSAERLHYLSAILDDVLRYIIA